MERERKGEERGTERRRGIRRARGDGKTEKGREWGLIHKSIHGTEAYFTRTQTIYVCPSAKYPRGGPLRRRCLESYNLCLVGTSRTQVRKQLLSPPGARTSE